MTVMSMLMHRTLVMGPCGMLSRLKWLISNFLLIRLSNISTIATLALTRVDRHVPYTISTVFSNLFIYTYYGPFPPSVLLRSQAWLMNVMMTVSETRLIMNEVSDVPIGDFNVMFSPFNNVARMVEYTLNVTFV